MRVYVIEARSKGDNEWRLAAWDDQPFVTRQAAECDMRILEDRARVRGATVKYRVAAYDRAEESEEGGET